jgi:hypothetical protein
MAFTSLALRVLLVNFALIFGDPPAACSIEICDSLFSKLFADQSLAFFVDSALGLTDC